MVTCEQLFGIFKKNGFTFFSGVPDSTFKDWMKFLQDEESLTNIIAVNECEATAICAGYHLATGKTGVVYMQNSGEGKTINPLTSLCDPEVYSIPVLLMIGWRGEPKKKDEPQHKKMGRVMIPLLKTLEINHIVLEDDVEKIERDIRKAKEELSKNNAPFAIIIRKGLIEKYEQKKERMQDLELTREDALKEIVDKLNKNDIVVSTTGKTSRELFEYREEKTQGHGNDFYTVGSMGCASSIALGVALEKKDRNVFVFDGDGAFLMQMGTAATIGKYAPENLFHVVFDNESHDSTGGQPTVSGNTDFQKIASACGYNNTEEVSQKKDLVEKFEKLKMQRGPSLLLVRVKRGARKDLGRPTTTPKENKQSFMKSLKK